MKRNFLRSSAIAVAVLAMLSLDSCKKEIIPTSVLTQSDVQLRIPVGLYSLESNYLDFSSLDLFEEMVGDTGDTMTSLLKVELDGLSGFTTYASVYFDPSVLQSLPATDSLNLAFEGTELIYHILNEDGVFKLAGYLVRIVPNEGTGGSLGFGDEVVYMKEYEDSEDYDAIVEYPEEMSEGIFEFTASDEIADIIAYLDYSNGVWEEEDYALFRPCNENSSRAQGKSANSGEIYVGTKEVYPNDVRSIWLDGKVKYGSYGVYFKLVSSVRAYFYNGANNNTVMTAWNKSIHTNVVTFTKRCETSVTSYANKVCYSNQDGWSNHYFYSSTTALHAYSLRSRFAEDCPSTTCSNCWTGYVLISD